jgi:oligoribonuclease NrnB/cAMP/cGMP phosphodiesterase (DHH superfamily)
MKRYVLYHSNCYDGFGAAYAALGWASKATEREFIPCAYVNPLPEIDEGAEVAILDFSFPRHVLEELVKRCASLIVLDHHKTAQADLVGLPFARFDMSKSGAVLAWEYFNPGQRVPMLLQYVQDRDLWLFGLPKSREVHAALRSYPMDFVVWTSLAARVEVLQTEGEILLRAAGQQVKTMADGAFDVLIGDHLVPCVNATMHFSEVGEELCRRFPERPFSAFYLDRADGKRQFGLRARGDFDVSEVARQYGGGGHKGAAGFVVDRPSALSIVPGVAPAAATAGAR